MQLFFYYLLAVNLLSLVLCGVDKYRAQRGQWRIRESSLFTLAFLGGSAGLYVGMQLFRHKTCQRRFTLGIPLLLLCQIVLGLLLFFRRTAA